jgi:hypothetical protein
MLQERVRPYIPEIKLREGEITLGDAIRRLEIPLYACVGAGTRLLGWSYDVSHGLEAITNPKVIRNSVIIKYGIPLAVGALYLAQSDSVARDKVEATVDRVKNFVGDIRKPGSNRPSCRRLIHSFQNYAHENFDHSGTMAYGMQFAVKGVETNFKIAKWGIKTIRNVFKIGLNSGKELIDIGSRIWFVNRGLQKVDKVLNTIDPVATTFVPAEIYSQSFDSHDFPSDWGVEKVRFRRL